MDENPEDMTRRSAMKTVATGIGVTMASGTVLGKKGTNTKSELPAHVSGTRKYHFTPDSESNGFVRREHLILLI
ncbi:hypothetical protein [Haladaptatus cibarius]|uniref:hypothetical protein n=1 Tax=Haladaptatus cibarius TaxID=453847 RepID=UPI001187243C|nr:hypothetical protein [Haladaptatus cibarius]